MPLKRSSEPTRTVLTICTGLVVVYLVTQQRHWLLATVLLGAAGIFSTALASLIDKLWMKLAWLLSQIVPNILLGVVFYFFLFPIALAARFFGRKDPLNLRNRLASNYVEPNKEFDKKSFEKYW